MNYKKLIGWGVAAYAAAFLVISGFIAYKMGDSIYAQIVAMVAVAAVVYFGGRSLGASSAMGVLKYSLGWVIIVAILDALFTVPFTGWEYFMSWEAWLGYAIILLVPLCGMKKDQALQTNVQQPPMV